jgi:streptomycin 6-kinase
MAGSTFPELDDELRRRLGRRYGRPIEGWLDALPPVLSDLAERWEVELKSLIQRGSMSVVILCRASDGRPAVLKVSPDRTRLADEAAALARWHTVHVPAVLAVDESVGALLIEAIEPGTPLVESDAYPSMESMIGLMTSLHADEPPATYRPVADRVAYLFDSGMKNYERKPQLVELVPTDLYERGRQLAMRLAADAPAIALLHGDLTPVNILDGGEKRGLVAIDPAPCLGDPAFDAIDLVLWRAEDADTIAARAGQLAPAIGSDPERLLDWCTAFAGMTALEMAEAPGISREQVEPFVGLASRVWDS